MTQRILYVKLS